MLHVPATWPCAQHACAFVQVVHKDTSTRTAAQHSDGVTADAVFLCRLVVVSSPATRFAFAPTVRVPAAVAAALTQQDCTAAEAHAMRWSTDVTSCCGSSSSQGSERCNENDDNDDASVGDGGVLYYMPCEHVCHNNSSSSGGGDDNGDDSVTDNRHNREQQQLQPPPLLLHMVLRCPLVLHTATTATLRGPRVDARATAAYVAAALRGCYVCVGACVHTRDGHYTVAALDMRHGYGGVALLAASCQVRLNAPRAHATAHSGGGAATTQTAAAHHHTHGDDSIDNDAIRRPLRPVAIDAAVDTLLGVLRMAHARPGSVAGVLVRGPAGCGVTMLIRYCLHVCAADVDVLAWRANGAAATTTAATTNARRVVVLLLRPIERCFDAEAPELAAVAMRRLTRDVAMLAASTTTALRPGGGDGSGSARRSVVVLATTHHYATAVASEVVRGFFATDIALTLPDAEQRAQILAACRRNDSNKRGGDGVTAADCRRDALALVGKTSREVVAWARRARGAAHTRVPFHAVRWADIGGLRDVKAQLHRALVWPQHEPEAFARFGLVPPKGVLLYGPPGCAKTTLVKALCSEGNFTFQYLDSASVVSAYVGESERYLRDIFARAAQRAPCIVFFDEVEVLGARRGDDRDAMHTRLLSTLLTEMDGFASRAGVCFVGATNVPHLLDPALLRPGRFDYLVYVPLPDEADRADILRLLLRHTAADVAALARVTHGFSGADLHALCSSALLELLAPRLSCADTVAAAAADKDGDDAAAKMAAMTLLRDANVVTAALCNAALSFPRCQYDVTALEQFRREHGGVE